MSLRMRFINKAAIGFTLSVLLWIGLCLFYMAQSGRVIISSTLSKSFGNDVLALIVEILLAGCIGFVGMGGSVIYEIEKWSIVRCTATHFILTMGTFSFIATYLKWFEGDMVSFIIWLVAMVVAYVMIWLIQYFVFKKQVREINENLQRLKNNENAYKTTT